MLRAGDVYLCSHTNADIAGFVKGSPLQFLCIQWQKAWSTF
jgi:hypothetical protein